MFYNVEVFKIDTISFYSSIWKLSLISITDYNEKSFRTKAITFCDQIVALFKMANNFYSNAGTVSSNVV